MKYHRVFSLEQSLALWSTLDSRNHMPTGAGDITGQRSKGHGLHVFWEFESQSQVVVSEAELARPQPPSIQHKIKSLLLDIGSSASCERILVQFWAPIRTAGGQIMLTASHQPFGIGYLFHGGLCWFRDYCAEHQYGVGVEDTALLGPPGRVFTQGSPEICPDVRDCYSQEEFPLKKHALECGIRGYAAVPLFERDGQCCIGVLELSSFDGGFFSHLIDVPVEENYLDQQVHRCNWDKTPPYFTQMTEQTHTKKQKTLQKIRSLAEFVQWKHRLFLVQVWVPCLCHIAPHNSCSSSNPATPSRITRLFRDYYTPSAFEVSQDLTLHEPCWVTNDRSLVGRAYSQKKPCFVPDFSQFNIFDCPLLPFLRWFKVEACFAIPLQLIHPKFDHFVLELFLPGQPGDSNIVDTLGSLLLTLKKRCSSVLVQVEKFSVKLSHRDSDNIAYFDVYQNGSSDATAQKRLNDYPNSTGETAMASCSRGVEVSPIAAEADRIQINGSSDGTARKRDYSKLNDYPNSTGETAMASCSRGVEVSPNAAEADRIQIHGSSDGTARKRGYSKLNDHPNATGDKAKTCCSREVEVSPYAAGAEITLDDIKKCFCLKLIDAAKKLGVSRSTLKRICRQLGIKRWPSHKRKIVHRIQSSPRSPNAAEADRIQINGSSDGTARKRGYSKLNDHPNATGDKAKTCCSREVEVSPYAAGAEITLDDIKKCFCLKLIDAAKKLGVCRATLRRRCRQLGIKSWPLHKRKNVHRIQSSPRSPTRFVEGGAEVIQESDIEPPCPNNNQIDRDAAASDTIPKNAKGKNIAAQDEMDLDHSSTMIVKAIYKDKIVKFPLGSNSGIEELRRELDKRFEFKAEGFNIKYEDEGDWILVSCDEDLRFRMDELKSSGQTRMNVSIFPATL